MIKHLKIQMLVAIVIFIGGCSTRYWKKDFSDFAKSTQTIGTGIIETYEQIQEEEMTMRMAETLHSAGVKPADFEPRVLTFSHIRQREILIGHLTEYTRLLSDIISGDDSESIEAQSKKVTASLTTIRESYPDLFTTGELGTISALGEAIPQTLSTMRKRTAVLSIMKRNQPILEKICFQIKDEMASLLVFADSLFARQFMLLVADRWPDTSSRREKYAKLGRKITGLENTLTLLIQKISDTITTVSGTHRELGKSLRIHRYPVRSLRDMAEFAYRITQLYESFAREQEE